MEFTNRTKEAAAIICDIEGTTSSISFVKETLFPYALKNVEKFLQDNWDRDDVKEAVVELRKLATKDAEEKVEGAVSVLGDDEDKAKVLESVVKSVEWLMGNDRKVTPLKTLQGLIWEAGYKDGSIKGHVYDDVPKAFEKWSKSGHKMYIYSSGSVMAQKLLFGNTTAGDLLSHLSGHFDTKIGAKQEKESYEAIAKEIECATEEILFLTDIVKEAKAAKEAGVNVVMLDRPGNAPLTDEEKKAFVVVTSFDAIPLEEVTTGKRKIQEEEEKQEATKPAKVAKLEEVVDEKVDDGETHDKKTDEESKCDTAVEKIEIDRTDDAKTDQETESKVEETEEKMEVAEEVKEVVEEEKKEKEKVEEVVVTTEKTEDEKMEVDAKEAVESVEPAVAVVEEKEPEAEEVTEAEPKVLEEKEEEVVEKTEPVTEEPPTALNTDTVAAEEKKEEEVVNGKSEVEKIEDTTDKVEEKEATEAKEEKVEEETEKAAESTNGNAAEEVNGGGKKDDEVTEEKTENGKDEVKNGHNENATVAVADEEKTAQDSAQGSASDQVSSEVIVKKCVEPIKSPVAQPVEAAES